ncbi:MAG: C45 family autoproteolytic acyltransferase/hydrolase [Phenylobacterium sp.]
MKADDLVPVRLHGAPFERGQAQGRALAGKIHAHLQAWLGALGEAGVGDPHAYVADMPATTDFLTAIRRHTPDLLEEVEGLAVGAEAPFDLVLALQLLDEEWAHRVRTRQSRERLEKCSSVAIATATGAWIGQTMDLGTYTDGAQAALAIDTEAGRPAALVFTVAGMIGLMGVNAAGVGVCVNSLPQLASAPQGLPVAFVLRRLLQSASLGEAADLVRSLPHATNQHYLIAAPGGVRSFEASAEGVVEYRSPQSDRVLHTNHPLAAPGADDDAGYLENSRARLAALAARLSDGAASFEAIAGALSSCDDPRHPVCRSAGSSALAAFTTGSMISALAADGVTAWISPGPPREAGYRSFPVGSGLDD